MRATWYVLEDGSVSDPSEVAVDAKGILRHKSGKAVAMRGDVPRSRSIDVDAHRQMKPQPQPKPQQPASGYLTRDAQAGAAVHPSSATTDPDLEAARAEYQKVFDKKPFHGWDVATLREKIAAAPAAESKDD